MMRSTSKVLLLLLLVWRTSADELTPVTTDTSHVYHSVDANGTATDTMMVAARDDAGDSVDRSWWCPPGYRLMNKVRVCSQKSCVTTPNPNTNETDKDASTESCQPLTPSYVQCHKILLTASQYVVASDGSGLVIAGTNTSIALGQFLLLRNDTASVCLTNETSAVVREPNPWYSEDLANALPTSCMPFTMSSAELVESSNGTALAFDGSKSFMPNFYERAPNDSFSMRVCYALSSKILTCKKATGYRSEFKVLPNMDVLEVFEGGIVHPLGSYMLPLTTDDIVVYCFEDTYDEVERRDEKRFLYGIATAVSAAFLFLALLAHTFFPSLNYHAMALLCHIISMLVMYVTLSISYLSPPSEAGWPASSCYALFAVGYVSALGAFFWLSVLAFDLWRIFARMRGTFSPANDKRKRIRFFVQCAYSWGIPSVMCVVLLIIDNDDDLEQTLGLPENIQFMCWFTNKTLQFIFFYLPIIAILLSNVVFFALTVYNLRNAVKGSDVLNKKVNRQLFRVFVKLFVVMGITWFAEVVSWLFPVDVRYYYVTDMINALQGVSIFLVYVCKRSSLELIRQRLGWCGGAAANKRTSQATQSSSTSQAWDCLSCSYY